MVAGNLPLFQISVNVVAEHHSATFVSGRSRIDHFEDKPYAILFSQKNRIFHTA